MTSERFRMSDDPHTEDDISENDFSVDEVNFFDQEEVHENCTVVIWRNSVTGDESVGWWDNE